MSAVLEFFELAQIVKGLSGDLTCGAESANHAEAGQPNFCGTLCTRRRSSELLLQCWSWGYNQSLHVGP